MSAIAGAERKQDTGGARMENAPPVSVPRSVVSSQIWDKSPRGFWLRFLARRRRPGIGSTAPNAMALPWRSRKGYPSPDCAPHLSGARVSCCRKSATVIETRPRFPATPSHRPAAVATPRFRPSARAPKPHRLPTSLPSSSAFRPRRPQCLSPKPPQR